MVVHGRHPAWRHDEAEQRERPISGPEEQPLADAATHPTVGRRLLEPDREPAPIGEQPDEERLDELTGLLRRRRIVDLPPNSVDELAYRRGIEDVLVLGERRQGVVEVAHRIGRPEL